MRAAGSRLRRGDGWIDTLRRDAFRVPAEHRCHLLLLRLKRSSGIANAMVFCHTGRIDLYMIEDPSAAGIRRLLHARRDAVRRAVPGIPRGWPCTGPQNEQADDGRPGRCVGHTDDLTASIRRGPSALRA